jgi:hypothetical protein
MASAGRAAKASSIAWWMAFGAVFREGVDLGQQIAQAQIGVDAGRRELLAEALEDVGQEGGHRVAEEHRVGDLHHGGLEVHRPQQILGLGGVQGLRVELLEGRHRHVGGVDDLAVEHLHGLVEHGPGAVVGDVDDAQRPPVGDEGLLVAVEVVAVHVGDAGLDVGGPGAEAVRVGLGIGLDRLGGAAVRVPLPQHRVDRRAEHRRIARRDLPGGVVGALGIVGDVESLGLQLGDRRCELGHRGRDVRQLDDAGRGVGGQPAELCEVVGHPLALGQPVGELGEDPRCQRDVAGGHLDAGVVEETLDDRQQRVGRQSRRLVDLGPDDRGHEDVLLAR